MHRHHFVMFCFTVAASAYWLNTAQAETSHADSSDAPLTIVVTSRLIDEAQQQVPISVVSVSPKALQDRGITSAQALQEAVPGLFVTAPNARLSAFSLRGLGTSSFNEGLESSVALFVDGVYLGRQGMSVGDLIDIERIEVARGPQGSLFGKNATAGTISIFTRAPTFTPEADLEVSLGDYGTQQYRGTVSGGLSETLAGRLTAYSNERDGFITNRFNGEKVNNLSRQGLRGQLLWAPTTHFSTRIIAELGELDERCCAFPLLGKPRANIQASDDYVGYQRVSGDPTDRISDSDIGPRSQVSQQALSAQATWDVSLRHRLVSISAYRDFEFKPITDDNTSLRIVSGGISSAHTQFSQELRLESRWGKVDSVAGFYFLDQTTRGQEEATLGADAGDYVFGGLIRQQVPFATRQNTGLLLNTVLPRSTLDGMQAITPFEQHSRNLSAFSSLNWRLTDRLAVSGGVRFSDERKATDVQRFRQGGNPNASVLALTNSLVPLGNLLGINLSGASFNQLLDDTVGGPFQRNLAIHERSLSGNIGLSMQWLPELNSYAAYSHGVKSGGVNLGVTGASTNPIFKPETANSLEIGLKSLLFDERLLMNLAIYHTLIRDYQAVSFDESNSLIPNPRLNNILNVGQVTLQGVDFDVQAALPGRISVRGGVAYNIAVTDEFTNAPDEDSRTNTRDLSGEPLANAPRWQGTFAVRKDWSLSDTLDFYASADYWFRSDFNATIERGRAAEIEGYGVLGARLGLRSPRDTWDLSVWARNLTDEQYISAITALYGVGDYGAYAGDPRLIGTTLRVKLR